MHQMSGGESFFPGALSFLSLLLWFFCETLPDVNQGSHFS